MKKGDVIEKLKFLEPGRTLMCNFKTQEEAEGHLIDIEDHFNFKNNPNLGIKQVPELGWCIVCGRDCFIVVQAKVKWVVEEDFAVEYLDTGAQEVLSILHVDGQGWNVVFEGTPVYQDSVEHMSDEQLRASIEDLRARRLSQPVTKSRVTRVSKSTSTPESAEDKQLSSVLNGMSLEAKAELMKKLGLVD